MSVADAYDAFLCDLDGVIWRGNADVPGVAEAIAALRAEGKRFVFVTNNSSRTPREVAIRLMRAKVPTATSDVVTSGHVVAAELRRIDLGSGDRIHVCGTDGLTRLLAHERFVPTDETEDVKAVVVGWNPRLTYDDIRRAADLARAGLPFIASNDDATYPAADGVVPGTGSILAAIQTAAGRQARVVGKPRPELFRIALERAEVAPQRALVCGDRPETDLAGARAAGIPCALVLTGVTSERDLGRLREVPDVILDDLTELASEDVPPLRVTRSGGGLTASSAGGDGVGGELATLRCRRDGHVASLEGVDVGVRLGRAASWRVVRRLLVEALAGAAEVEAEPELQPYLERIGVDAAAQRRLFGS